VPEIDDDPTGARGGSVGSLLSILEDLNPRLYATVGRDPETLMPWTVTLGLTYSPSVVVRLSSRHICLI